MNDNSQLTKTDITSKIANITQTVEPMYEFTRLDKQLIKSNIKRAINLLKKLYIAPNKCAIDLPFYLVIGPQASGKTTLFESSGIPFFEQAQLVQQTPKDLRILTDINWWVSNSAVFIDIPGYYIESPKNIDYSTKNSLWIYLLKVLKAQLKICGIINVIDIPSIIADKGNGPTLDCLQIRLQELANIIRYPLTMQLVFTKLDIVDGFIEFFDDLSKEERELSCGIVLANTTQTNNKLIEQFTNGFDNLLQRLNERVIQRLHQEHSINRRLLIKNFCLQLALLNTPLSKIIFQLGSVTDHFKHIKLNALFFCSSKQTNTTKNLLLENFSNHFKLNISHEHPINIKSKAYFVQGLINDLLKLSHSKNSNRKPLNPWLSRLTVTSLLCMTMAGCYLFYREYQQQSALITMTQQTIEQYQVTSYRSSQPAPISQILLTLDNLYTIIAKFTASPWQRLYFMDGYTYQTMNNKLSQLYNKLLQQQFYPLINSELEQNLIQAINNSPEQLLDSLKAYIMLSDRPHRDNRFIVNRLIQQWQRQSIQYNPTLLITHVTNALAKPINFNRQNKELIKQARKALNSQPEYMIAYKLIKQANQSPLVDIAGKHTQLVFGNTPLNNSFSHFYSQQTFKKIYQSAIPHINDILKTNLWLLGDRFHVSNSVTFIATLKTVYLNDYLDQWQQLTHELSVQPFVNYQQALTIIKTLATKDSPFYHYIHYFIENTESTLPKGWLNNKQAAFAKQILRNKDKIFTEQKQLTQQLVTLATWLETIMHHDIPAKASFDFAKEYFLATLPNNAIEQLINYANTVPFPLSQWLHQVASNIWALILEQTNLYINSQWHQRVLPFYQSHLANKYPLDRNATLTIDPIAFSQFFAAKGILPNFFAHFLLPFTNTQQAQWAIKTIHQHGLPISQTALLEIERALLMGKMFSVDKNAPAQQYTLELIASTLHVNSVTLLIGQRSLRFARGAPTSASIPWSSQDSLSLIIQDHHGKQYRADFPGPWGVLKFLDHSKLEQTSDVQHYEFEYSLADHIVKFSLVANQFINPFIKGVVEQFKLEKQL